ncbi:DUF2813 domain-containing protein [Clostridium oceanicum]|uniref:Nuclease SbcCD subunit C n=1 Tax=Clostridium oceanicum TaxID=1543 RepID=A0ABP3UIF2_9CLOT
MLKKIILRYLSIRNFKGIKNLNLEFGQGTNIFGENGLGKTSIQDAFTFLLFDKDSKDSTKFDVQPLDKNNNPIHNLETVIEATLVIDGREIVLKRVYKEKYSKVRGTANTEFKGYENKYYVNEVPKKVTEYKKFIDELLNEKIFKLITNPMYFSALPWKNRRKIIYSIIENVDNIDVIKSNKDLKPLEKHIKDKMLNDFMKANKSKIRQLNKDREQIPSRIDELNNSMKELDFDALEFQKRSITAGIKNIDKKIIDKSEINKGLIEIKNKILEKEYNLSQLEYELKLKGNKPKENLESKIRMTVQRIKHSNTNIQELEGDIQRRDTHIKNTLKPKRDKLLKEYRDIKVSTFEIDENNFICPTCKRKFDNEDIENKKIELEQNFNISKAKKLEENIKQGKMVAEEKKDIEERINLLQKRLEVQRENIKLYQNTLENLKSKLNSIKDVNIEDTEESKKLKEEIEALKNQVEDFKQVDISELKKKKTDLSMELEYINSQLAYKEMNQKTLDRINELEEKETKLSENIAELEGLEILSEEFIRSKVKLLEDKVNSKFKYVKFKMFNNQINGGLEECCEPCIDGVTFTSNLNTAAKINAGLDIINTLCSHYGVQAPIFIDNRESVNQLIETNSQIINLIVSTDKEFRVEVM